MRKQVRHSNRSKPVTHRRKQPSSTTIYKSGTQSPSNPMKFVMSSETVDCAGDIIVAKGWQLRDFKRNPIALFAHNHTMPIGTWKDVKIEGKRLVGTLKMARKGTSKLVDEVRSLLEQRVLRSVSVGFSATEYAPLNKDKPYEGYKFTKTTLHECSVVSVPANPEALAVAKSLGISRETERLIFAKGRCGTTLSRYKTKSRSSQKPRSQRKTYTDGPLSRAIVKLVRDGFAPDERQALTAAFRDDPQVLAAYLRGDLRP